MVNGGAKTRNFAPQKCGPACRSDPNPARLRLEETGRHLLALALVGNRRLEPSDLRLKQSDAFLELGDRQRRQVLAEAVDGGLLLRGLVFEHGPAPRRPRLDETRRIVRPDAGG